MNDIMTVEQMVSALLLVLRIVGSVYLIKVLAVQAALLRVPAVDEHGRIDEGTMKFRRVLTRMTAVVLAGQIAPIAIDLVGVLYGDVPFWLSIVYVLSNAITALVAAILIWKLYEMALDTKTANDEERVQLQAQHEKELADKV